MKTILVPVNFSPASKNAARYAAQLARDIKARVCLCHICFPTGEVLEGGLVLATNNPFLQDLKKRLHDMKIELNREFGSEIDISCMLRVGFFMEQMYQITSIDKNDFVIIGIETDKKVEKSFEDSNAFGIVKRIKSQAIIVPSGVKYTGIFRIAFACDYQFSNPSRLIDRVVDFAKSVRAKLDVVHINNKGSNMLTKENAVKTIVLEDKMTDLNHDYFVVNNKNIFNGITEFVNRYHSDLIIMLPKRRSIFERIFKDSETKRMMFNGDTPLLAIH